ncbi:hypothetical protein EPUS_01067 [Endocarpon pusillum Z07020]|uniref:PABS domain-containing protein n=1 Tax=Endocarpon pusillum (strain Z07020 / HMAS-L-300199) TaxID=1263415 RepID=U1GBP8_ENDPU|nr:uncharacterized protein EPUS_01067 [Endocarpon pusillum Z07020]ERF69111.1 hypothetical protein EPUS_01067 [Endocarpon pusillum Z07020]
MAEVARPKNEQGLSKEDPPASVPRIPILSNVSFHKALQLIILAAVYSPVSWLSLTAVYGSVPSALYHNLGKYLSSLIGFLGWKQLRKILPPDIARWLPAFAFWIPTLQFSLFKYSSALGPLYGPVITELLTYYPLTLLSLFAAGTFLDEVDFSGLGSTVAEQGPSVGTYFVFTTIEKIAKSILFRNMGSNIVMSRIGLQVIIAIMYALAIPKAVLWPIIPSIAFTMTYNVHNPLQRTTNVLNSTLQLHNFTLIDRQESITGYISVLDNSAAHYRVMRCDHSLLGGEWKIPLRKGSKPARAQEPIYAIFTMLEAVRLVETNNGQPRRPDPESTALNIGLGIGTAPGALIAHGINTTIVELDPVVYDFAVKYFGLPSNHTPIIGDAVHLVQDAQARNITTKYDYIIHDVFTGGAEPVDLFTQEFLSGLKYLLKEDGVIAINYAGDLSLPSASHVIRTIFSVFRVCRIFREALPEEAPSEKTEDFTNMVIFCTHPSSENKPLTFRQPILADFLESGARQQSLFPRPELEIKKEVFELEGPVLKRGQTRQLERWHRRSAVGHWRIMRTVLPDVVWENW